MEYFRLAEPFAVGARGVLRAVGGEEAAFRVVEVGPGFVYSDATALEGAELIVRHEAVAQGDGVLVELSAFVDGPEAATWAPRLASDLQCSLEHDLASLAAMLEESA